MVPHTSNTPIKRLLNIKPRRKRMIPFLNYLKGILIILSVILGIILLGNIGKGIQTIEPDMLIIKTKAAKPLDQVIASYPDIQVVDSTKNIVRFPENKMREYFQLPTRNRDIARILPVEKKPTFRFQLYLTAVKDQILQLLKGNLGTITFGNPYKIREITYFLKDMVIHSFSYLIPGIILGVIMGYVLAVLSTLKPAIGKINDFIHTVLMSLPDFFVVVLLQLLVIVIDRKVGYPIIAVNPYKEITPLLIPTLSISILPAAIVYGTMRMAITREWTQDYIKTAYSKGLSYKKIVISHILRNTTVDLITILPRAISIGITTMVIAEVMSSIMGLGGYAISNGVVGVTSLVTTCSILAFFALFSHLIFAYLKERLVVAPKETDHA